jgi:steroid 5-alpha reductase family enzyme
MNRPISFLIVIAVYILAAALGILVFILLKPFINNVIILTFIANICATLVVWVFGVIFKNSSMYDPYWSVQPLVIISAWLVINGQPLRFGDMLMLICIGFWAVRLTYNWASGFMGLTKTQDWRYTMLRGKNPKLFFVTNLFGINLMPTVLVYLGTVPLYFAITGNSSFNAFTSLGLLTMVIATMIQLIADKQMKDFRRDSENAQKVMDRGLWAYSRHPNYLGEIVFWWGVYVFSFSNLNTPWYSFVGAVLITLLFLFISIPMIEKKLLKTRSGYEEYKQRVSMLLLLPPKKSKSPAQD